MQKSGLKMLLMLLLRSNKIHRFLTYCSYKYDTISQYRADCIIFNLILVIRIRPKRRKFGIF